MVKRTVFFVSDQTGVTAETMGHSLLTQFDGAQYQSVSMPFIATVGQAEEVVRSIDAAARESALRPIVFATLVDDTVREIVQGADALVLDFFAAFLGPLETELGLPSAHASGRAHGMADLATYTARINATNYALANDDGAGARDYASADVILVGVSRSGKTPTCVFLALQYGVYAANYPLAEEDLDSGGLPAVLAPHRHKLFGLTIRAERLQQIRNERRPGSRYASLQQVEYELRAAVGAVRARRLAVPRHDRVQHRGDRQPHPLSTAPAAARAALGPVSAQAGGRGVQEAPRGRLRSRRAGDLDDCRPAFTERALERRPQFRRAARVEAEGAKTFGERAEVGIAQLDAEVAAGVFLLLVATHVAVSRIVEHDGDQVDAVLDGRGQFLDPEQEAAIAADGDHGPVGPARPSRRARC